MSISVQQKERVTGSLHHSLVGATLGFFFGFAAVALFGPTAQYFREAMNLNPTQVSFLVAMPALSGSLLRIPFGAWAGTNGGRKPFLTLLLLSILGMGGLTIVVNVVPSENLNLIPYPLLLILGVLCGCGIATFPVGVAQVSYWFPRAKQGTALAVYAGIGNLAPGVFSLALPAFLLAWGLGGAYLIWLCLLVAGTVGYAVLGRDAWYFQLLRRGLTPEEARHVATGYGQEFFPAGNTMEGLRLAARLWQTWALVLVYFTTFGGFVALTAWLPTYWTSYFGLSAIAAGSLTAAYSLGTSGIRILGGVMSDRLRRGGENTAILALLIMLNGVMLMTMAELFQVAVLGLLLMAIGMGICNAAVFKMVAEGVPQAVGGASGWVGGLGALGGFVIPPIMGFVVQQEGHIGYPLGFLTFVVLVLGALTAVWVLKYTHSEQVADR